MNSTEKFREKVKSKKPSIEIISEYNGCEKPVKCKCLICDYEWTAIARYLTKKPKGNGCPECGKRIANQKKSKTHEQYELEIKEKYPNIELLSKYTKSRNSITYYCSICQSENTMKANLLYNRGCSVCGLRRVKDGVRSYDNSIKSKRPDLLSYLKYPEQGDYNCGSDKKITLVCPDCLCECEQKIESFVRRGFNCPVCSDNISYPNRVIRALMNQLDVNNLSFEYSPEWIKPRRYDCYFEINNTKYIVEMDGRWHFCDNALSGTSAEDTQKNDKSKDSIAANHGIQVIRIDCYYSDFDYIKNNILRSELSNIFNLQDINWKQCLKDSQSKIIKKVCEYYNNHSDMSFKEIGKIFYLDGSTIQRYIKIGDELNWCCYDSEKIKLLGIKKSAQAKFKPIDVYDENNQLLYHFCSIKECCSCMTETYMSHFNHTHITESYKNSKLYKGFYFRLSQDTKKEGA